MIWPVSLRHRMGCESRGFVGLSLPTPACRKLARCIPRKKLTFPASGGLQPREVVFVIEAHAVRGDCRHRVRPRARLQRYSGKSGFRLAPGRHRSVGSWSIRCRPLRRRSIDYRSCRHEPLPQGTGASQPRRTGAPERAEGATRSDARCPRPAGAKRETACGEAGLLIQTIHKRGAWQVVRGLLSRTTRARPLAEQGRGHL